MVLTAMDHEGHQFHTSAKGTVHSTFSREFTMKLACPRRGSSPVPAVVARLSLSQASKHATASGTPALLPQCAIFSDMRKTGNVLRKSKTACSAPQDMVRNVFGTLSCNTW